MDPRLVSYHEDFINEASLRGINDLPEIGIVVGSFDSPFEDKIIARCIDFTIVKVDLNKLNLYPYLVREEIMFHEFGHCILKIEGHTIEFPTIMKAGFSLESFELEYYIRNREMLLDGLFLLRGEVLSR